MQKRLIWAIAGLLSVLMAAFIANSVYSSLNIDVALEKQKKAESKEQKEENSSWTAEFAKKSKAGFEYPAEELQIRLDLFQSLKDQTVFRVVIGDVDEYKLFCINQIFKSADIKYSYLRSSGEIKLIITARDEEYLKKVLESLREYGINYKLDKTLVKG